MVRLFNVIFVGCIDCLFCNIVAKGINLMCEIASTVGFFRKVIFCGYLGHVFGLIGTRICGRKGHVVGGTMGGAKSSANHQIK